MSNLRIGQGWDIHKLIPCRALYLGGLEIPSPLGAEAHSDGDVLIHAVIDALLGALALGDIGTHFPPSDPAWKNADSKELLAQVMEMVQNAGFLPVNLDCTVILQEVRLAPFREQIAQNLSSLVHLEIGRVSVKAKTKEGVDAVGEGRAIEAMAVVLLQEAEPEVWV